LLSIFQANLFGHDLGLTVGPDAVQPVGLPERVVVGDAVDGGGRDVDKALDPLGLGFRQKRSRPVDIGGKNVLWLIKGESPFIARATAAWSRISPRTKVIRSFSG
jgi:hypothetical protein